MTKAQVKTDTPNPDHYGMAESWCVVTTNDGRKPSSRNELQLWGPFESEIEAKQFAVAIKLDVDGYPDENAFWVGIQSMWEPL
jgi:hypothetical protein